MTAILQRQRRIELGQLDALVNFANQPDFPLQGRWQPLSGNRRQQVNDRRRTGQRNGLAFIRNNALEGSERGYHQQMTAMITVQRALR